MYRPVSDSSQPEGRSPAAAALSPRPSGISRISPRPSRVSLAYMYPRLSWLSASSARPSQVARLSVGLGQPRLSLVTFSQGRESLGTMNTGTSAGTYASVSGDRDAPDLCADALDCLEEEDIENQLEQRETSNFTCSSVCILLIGILIGGAAGYYLGQRGTGTVTKVEAVVPDLIGHDHNHDFKLMINDIFTAKMIDDKAEWWQLASKDTTPRLIKEKLRNADLERWTWREASAFFFIYGVQEEQVRRRGEQYRTHVFMDTPILSLDLKVGDRVSHSDHREDQVQIHFGTIEVGDSLSHVKHGDGVVEEIIGKKVRVTFDHGEETVSKELKFFSYGDGQVGTIVDDETVTVTFDVCDAEGISTRNVTKESLHNLAGSIGGPFKGLVREVGRNAIDGTYLTRVIFDGETFDAVSFNPTPKNILKHFKDVVDPERKTECIHNRELTHGVWMKMIDELRKYRFRKNADCCPSGHGLKDCNTLAAGLKDCFCDICGDMQDCQEEGARMQSCRTCNWDRCEKCKGLVEPLERLSC